MCVYGINEAFLVAQMNLSAIQETQFQSLGQEEPLEEVMAIYSNILAWRIPWAEKPGAYSTYGHAELDKTEWLTHTQYNQAHYVKTVKKI